MILIAVMTLVGLRAERLPLIGRNEVLAQKCKPERRNLYSDISERLQYVLTERL